MNNVYRVVRLSTRVFFKLYGKLKIVGYENLPKEGPVIVACNHVSYMDPMMLGAAIMRECAFMARHDLFEKKFLAWLMPKLGSFPVNRDKRDLQAIKTGIERLNQGLVLVIFPEGGRTDDGDLQRGEPGAALFVQKSGAPVVPAIVLGAEEMMPVGASKLKRAQLKLVFGKPIQFDKSDSREFIIAEVMRAIAKLLTDNGKPAVAKEDLVTDLAEMKSD